MNRTKVLEIIGSLKKLTNQLEQAALEPETYWPSYDKFPYGTRVRTTEDIGLKDWSERGDVKWHMGGIVVDRSDSHGLCYKVRHEDGSTAWYDPEELERE